MKKNLDQIDEFKTYWYVPMSKTKLKIILLTSFCVSLLHLVLSIIFESNLEYSVLGSLIIFYGMVTFLEYIFTGKYICRTYGKGEIVSGVFALIGALITACVVILVFYKIFY